MTVKEWIKNNFDNTDIETLYTKYLDNGNTSSYKYFKEVYNRYIANIQQPSLFEDNRDDISEYYEKELAKKERQIQKLRDTNTALRRTSRNAIRDINTIDTMVESFREQFSKIKLNLNDTKHISLSKNKDKKYGIIFLSDIHANTRVNPNEANNNVYNIDIMSKRLDMFVTKAIEHFLVTNVTDIYVILGGDLISSTRRNDEKLVQITSLTNASYIVVDIISQILTRLYNNGFKVNLTGIVGNESRLNQQDFSMDYKSATENFDWMILLILSSIFRETDINIIIPKNPVTSILQLPFENNNFNILINHGFNTKCTEDGAENVWKSVDKVVDKINLGIYGHFHHFVSFGKNVWNGCVMGNNSYSTNLGYSTSAEQTIFVIESPSQFYALPIFIQYDWENYSGFKYDKLIANEAELQKEYGYYNKGPEIILR